MSISTSTMLDLGVTAPEFSLMDCDGKHVALSDFDAAKAYLIVFLGGCLFVRHIGDRLAEVAKNYQKKSVAVIGISPHWNDTLNEALAATRQLRQAHGFTFPCLIDRTMDVAKAYHVACTPSCYVFDAERKLVYRGQFDDSRPKDGTVPTGKDVTDALDGVLEGKSISEDQKTAFGCSLYFKPGKEPDYVRPL